MNSNPADLINGLPGADLIREGLGDYRENRRTMPSCLVRMARRRLVRAGLMEASPKHDIDAELDLYQLLSHEGNQAHSRYNSLIRQLISFEHALDHRLSQAVPSSTSRGMPNWREKQRNLSVAEKVGLIGRFIVETRELEAIKISCKPSATP